MKLIKKEYKAALEKLLAFYKQHTDTTIYNAQKREWDWSCPLCQTNDELDRTCASCPWPIMTGLGCVENNFHDMQVVDRIAQIEEWLKHIEPEFPEDQIICNLSRYCDRNTRCGGAIPHTKQGCEQCPIESSAKCIPLSEFIWAAECDKDLEHRLIITKRTYENFGNQP